VSATASDEISVRGLPRARARISISGRATPLRDRFFDRDAGKCESVCARFARFGSERIAQKRSREEKSQKKFSMVNLHAHRAAFLAQYRTASSRSSIDAPVTIDQKSLFHRCLRASRKECALCAMLVLQIASVSTATCMRVGAKRLTRCADTQFLKRSRFFFVVL
jgi:hypothetical protein